MAEGIVSKGASCRSGTMSDVALDSVGEAEGDKGCHK
jgi:hypothetical protein